MPSSALRDSTRRLLEALTGGVAGAPLGAGGFGLPGVTGVERARGPWDVVVTAHAPDVPGDTVTFVALEDGTLVVDQDVPDGSLTPLADAVETDLAPPYEAAAVRREDEGGPWRVAAARVLVAAAEPGTGEMVELARVGEDVTVRIDDVDVPVSAAPRTLLDLLGDLDGDAAVTAERLDGSTWVAERWAL